MWSKAADNSTSSGTKVKNEWNSTYTPPYSFIRLKENTLH